MKYINTVLNYIIMLTACHQDILVIIVPTFELEVNIFLGSSAVFFSLRCVLNSCFGVLF